jgi:DNA-binding transcriptional MerR regulator
MAETIRGGFYADASGALHNANGEPLSKDEQAQAERVSAEQREQRAQVEQQWVQAELRSNPIAQAFALQQQAQQTAPRSTAKGEK